MCIEKPTKILVDEHQHILKVINALIKECNDLESGKKIDKDFFTKAIDFIRNYADKFHHAKEEDILFVELCKDTVSMHCNPVEQMLHEHELGRNFVKGMEDGINGDNKEKVIENARGYAYLLQDHISKEDGILYPMADEVLDQSIQDSMLAKFKEVETNKFDSNTKEKYLSLAEEFKNR